MTQSELPVLTKKDFESDQDPRWCPGCGDYSILAQTQKTMPDFGVAKEKISMVKDTYFFQSPDQSPARFIQLFRNYYGPTMNAFEAAQKTGKSEELHKQLVELAMAQNKNTNGGTLIPATFLRVTVQL